MSAHDPKTLRAYIERVALPDIELSFRPMFGGILAYAGGRPAASLSNEGLALKFSGIEREELLAAGGEPLRYEPDSPPSKTYVLVPEAWLANRDALRPWLERCVVSVAKAPAKSDRRRRSRTD